LVLLILFFCPVVFVQDAVGVDVEAHRKYQEGAR